MTLCRVLLLLLCLGSARAMAQSHYGWQATVPAPARQGYHRILMPPAVTGRLRPDLADIRLYDAQQRETPYLLRQQASYTAIPLQRLTRTDSAAVKRTYITLNFAQPVYPELLTLQVTAPDLYLRKARVLKAAPVPLPRRKRRRRRYRTPPALADFTLRSGAPDSIRLHRQRVEELTLVIENEDNPPLQVAEVHVLQRNRCLVAKVEAGETYTLRFGNPAATAPTYDLQYFRDSVPAALPVLRVEDIRPVTNGQRPERAKSKILIWLAIGVVVAGLSYMSVRLLREMNREKK